MANVSINDLKIRVLQLKSLGYDKLLLQKSLDEQLVKVHKDLNSIAEEVTHLLEVIRQAEEQISQQPETQQPQIQTQTQSQPQTPAIQTPPTPSSNPSDDKPTHVKVDETKLGEILSPATLQKQKKTEHNIGRRVS